jgi:glycosyltransferase involved in cell wall biosynthesis
MNILFVSEYDWLESVVFDLHMLSEGLSLLGHQVYAIDREWGIGSRFRFRTREIKDVARAFPEGRVLLRRPGFMNFPGLGLLSTALTHYWEIKKIIRERKIDVIVLYAVLVSGLQSVYLAKKLNIPIVFRCLDIVHNLRPSPIARMATRILERRVYSKVDSVLAISPGYSEYVKSMGAPGSKVRLLLFPIDTGSFGPAVDCSGIRQKWGLNEKDQIVIFVGVLYEFSGLSDFIRQFPDVIRQVPEAKLLIVGDGPLRPELERIIAELGLKERIIITGYQPFETMPQYINTAAICINPFPITDLTKYIFSGKIIQYLACGKATIATPVPGMTTLIPGESCGVIYADSAAGMAREVVQLLKSSERKQQLGQAGLDYVQRAHDAEKVTRQLEAFLEEVIKEKRDTSR